MVAIRIDQWPGMIGLGETSSSPKDVAIRISVTYGHLQLKFIFLFNSLVCASFSKVVMVPISSYVVLTIVLRRVSRQQGISRSFFCCTTLTSTGWVRSTY